MNKYPSSSLEDLLMNAAKYILLSQGQTAYLQFLKEFNFKQTDVPFRLKELREVEKTLKVAINVVEKEYVKRGITEKKD